MTEDYVKLWASSWKQQVAVCIDLGSLGAGFLQITC